VRLTVELGPGDRRAHDEARGIYRDFLERNGIRMSSPSGWSDFIIRSARSEDGRRAMAAVPAAARDRVRRRPPSWTTSRCCWIATATIAPCCSRQDNATAYEISRRFLVPIITHETRVRERSENPRRPDRRQLRRGR
jgi:hypothetical protein